MVLIKWSAMQTVLKERKKCNLNTDIYHQRSIMQMKFLVDFNSSSAEK